MEFFTKLEDCAAEQISGGAPIDLSELGAKNLGQLNKIGREEGRFSGKNVPQDASFFGFSVDDWVQGVVLSRDGRGRVNRNN